MTPSHPNSRRGITLLEVMIAIGILAVGLTSVMALIPAGKSEAGKAVVLDRAATVAMNALADAITYGLTRPDSIVITGTGPGNVGNVVIYDPVNTPFTNASKALLKTAGVLSSGTHPAADAAIMTLVTLGRDDTVYSPPPTEDALPSNLFINGARAFDGRMSCLISIAKIDPVSTASLAVGDQARLSVIVFHNRDLTDPSATVVTGTYDAASGSLTVDPAQIPSGRTLKQLIRPGTVIYDSNKTAAADQSNRWSHVAMASVNETTTPPTTYVTFSGPSPGGGAVTILLDTVGMAEKVIRLEGPSPFGW
jgi:prepilin-type N-terminal cleavage/methylation domain-containing protein